MKVGSIVRLTNPYIGDMEYKNALGIVLRTYDSVLSPGDEICSIRFERYDDPLVHITKEIFKHRLSIVGE